MKFSKLLLLVVFMPFVTLAQGEAYNWYFGFGAGVHFNADGSVNALTDGQLNSVEGCASLSDNQGNLLFYSDGKTVYNRQHVIMANGDNLFGTNESTQSAIIIPKPESTTVFIIITTNAQLSEHPNNGLNYHEVDMSLDNGNGAVTLKNQKLLKHISEKVAVTAIIQDCAVESIWLVAFGTDQSFSFDNDTFHAIEINATGAVVPSVQSTIGQVDSQQGYLKFSLDGTKLASANMSSGLFLYDFDSTTGIVSNQQEITINAPQDFNSYGVEFSPNGNYLYVHASNDNPGFTGHTSSLFQYDVLAADISASQITLDQSRDLFRSALQLGPNGKIYRALTETHQNGTPFLGVINNPNELGLAADYEHNAVSLNGKLSAEGLPVFFPSAYIDVDDRLDEIVINENGSNLCIGSELSFRATYWNGAVYTWEKDNVELLGETGNILSIPDAQLTDSGTYQVTAYRLGAEACPLVAETQVVVESLPVIQNMELGVCDIDDDGLALFNFNDLPVTDMENYVFFETQENLENGINIVTIDAFLNTIPFDQTLYYSYTNESGCVANAELHLKVTPYPNIGLDEQYFICPEDADLMITLEHNFDSQNWFKIEGVDVILLSESDVLEVKEVGNYRVAVFNDVSTSTCAFTFDFDVIPSPSFEISKVVVNGNEVEIVMLEDGEYEYSLDDSTYQESNTLNFIEVQQNEIVYVRDEYGCTIMENVVEKYGLGFGYFPNFFTPNGDTINDFWHYVAPATAGIEPELEYIHIFDRHGKFIYQIEPETNGWNGTFNGRPLASSDYWYKALFEDGLFMHGHFSLKR